MNEEFISNGFKMLRDSYHLDHYWINTNKENVAFNTEKRKLDVLLNHSALQHNKKRSDKDRRLARELTDNKIIDYSNTGSSSQSHDIEDWDSNDITTRNYFNLPDLHVKVKDAIDALTNKKMAPYKRYTKSLSYQQQCPEDCLFIYKVISIIMDAHYVHPELFDISKATVYSERDISDLIWTTFLNALFSKSEIKIKSGDTILKDTNANYKVDSRLIADVGTKTIDISNVEIGKAAEVTKVKDDHQKIILEATTIIKHIISSYSFINPSTFNLFSLQVCYLKGDLLLTSLAESHKYITKRACSRIRVPLTTTDAESMTLFIQSLILYKEQVEETTYIIKHKVIKVIDTRRSILTKRLFTLVL